MTKLFFNKQQKIAITSFKEYDLLKVPWCLINYNLVRFTVPKMLDKLQLAVKKTTVW